MKCFVKDFSATVQAREIIFVAEVDDDLKYCGPGSKPFPLILSCICPRFFLSLL